MNQFPSSRPPRSGGNTNGVNGAAGGVSREIVPHSSWESSALAMPDGSFDGSWSGGGSRYGGGRYGDESDGFSLRSLLTLLRRRWKAMLLVFALIVAVQVVRLRASVPVYASAAQLEIITPSSGLAGAELAGLEQLMGGGRSKQLQTHINLLSGERMRERALEAVPAKHRATLQKFHTLSVEQEPNASLLWVRAQSHDPQASQALTNAICNEYVELSRATNQKASLDTSKYIEKKLENVEERLVSAQIELQRFKEREGIFEISTAAQLQSGLYSTARTGLEAAEAELEAEQALLNNTNQQLRAIPDRPVAQTLQRNERITELQAQIEELQTERRELTREFTDDSQRVRAVDAKIRRLRERLAAEPRNIVPGYTENPVRAALVQQRSQSLAKLEQLQARVSTLRAKLKGYEADASKLPSQEFVYTRLKVEADALAQTYQLLNERLESLRITAEAQGANALVTEPAEAGDQVSPDARRMIMSGIVVGLIAAFALALVWDSLDNRIYSEEDAQRATHLPTLAQIPLEKRPDRQLLLNGSSGITPMVESFRMLRANIAFSAADRPIRAVVVTSSVPDEGKSSTALNLAAAAAMGGERTVLIDLDLRRPTQHTIAGLPLAPGFSSVISGQATLDELYHQTSVPNLRVITAGPVVPNAFKLLNSQTARSLIGQIIEEADFVVIDTPPMLGLADARLISTMVDGTLLVVSCQETGRREAARSAEMLATTTGDALGIVLTKVPGGMGGYGSASTYRSYARYFEDDPAIEEHSHSEHSNGQSNGANGSHEAHANDHEPSGIEDQTGTPRKSG